MSRRQNKSKSLKIFISIGVLACAILGFTLYSKSPSKKRQKSPAVTSQQATKVTEADVAGLLNVVMPKDIPSQMLQYPGFVVSFNPETHIPNWVAWELTADEVRTNVVGKRSNKYAADVSVRGCPTLDDYRGSGYDRGHMAPAADMKWDQDAYEACYLLTNMCPQAKDLNGGAWRVLEEKCRSVALRDKKLVIVCGPVPTDRIVRHIGDNSVAVPERFFKVIISPEAKNKQGIGFIMPNTAVAGGVATTAMSIDRVEEITGYDFFSALDDATEAQIESQSNFLKWSQR